MKYISIIAVFVASYSFLFAAPDSMLDLMDTAVRNKQWEEAIKLSMRYKIEVRLAVACSTDASTAAAINQVMFRAMKNPQGYEQLQSAISAQRTKEIFVEQLTAAERDFNDNKLANPEWVARYGMGPMLQALDPSGRSAGESLFVPQAEWHEKRKQVLEQYRKALAQ